MEQGDYPNGQQIDWGRSSVTHEAGYDFDSYSGLELAEYDCTDDGLHADGGSVGHQDEDIPAGRIIDWE